MPSSLSGSTMQHAVCWAALEGIIGIADVQNAMAHLLMGITQFHHNSHIKGVKLVACCSIQAADFDLQNHILFGNSVSSRLSCATYFCKAFKISWGGLSQCLLRFDCWGWPSLLLPLSFQMPMQFLKERESLGGIMTHLLTYVQ